MVLAGEADVTNSERLAGELMDRMPPGTARLTVDVARLSFADSAAIRTLIFAARVLRARRGSLVLLHPDERFRQVLELTGAGTFMDYEPP